jgi:hypothetical protein
MLKLYFNVEMKLRNKAVKASEDTLIEVKCGMDAIRNLRTGIFQLAYSVVKAAPGRKGVLVLAESKMTEKRMQEEWQYASMVLKPELMERLGLVMYKDGQITGYPVEPEPAMKNRIQKFVLPEADREGTHIPKGDYYYEVLKVLIHQWFMNKGPMTADWLSRASGCSYPTVAAARRRLGPAIKLGSYRRLELANFPDEEWGSMVAVSGRVRATMRFADRSGQPRTPGSYMRRLAKMDRPDIGVGGVEGGSHYLESLDITGSPRLDLTVHIPGGRADLSFVEKLDPALCRIDDGSVPANVVVHFIRRRDSLFEPGAEGIFYADPVECLLDLHESRLEDQARQLFEALCARRGAMQ